MLYRLRYAYWLRRLTGISWWQALSYPTPDSEITDGDPYEDAYEEWCCMGQDAG